MTTCNHPRIHKAGFSRQKNPRQMWRCAVCNRASVNHNHFPGPKKRKPVEYLTKPCALCGKPVRRKATHFPNKNWFCVPDHMRQWHNDQLVIRRGKRGKRTNRRSNDMLRWSERDIEFLRQNYKTMDHEEMGLVLGRGAPAVQAKCNANNLIRKPLWTKAEEQFLIDNQHRGWKWCGEQLGRGRFAVSIRANALGLHCNTRLTPDQKSQVFKLHAQGLSNIDIAEIVGLKRSQAVVHYLKKRGLKSNRYDTNKARDKARRTMLNNHGVDNGGKLMRIRRRQARKAVLFAQMGNLRKALEAACPT